MAAAAHNPAFAKKVGVPVSVAQEFNKADKGKKFRSGGMAKSDMKEDSKKDMAQDKAMIKKAFKEHDAQEHKGGKGTKLTLKKGGMTKCAKGGIIEKMGPKTMKEDVEKGSNKLLKFGESAVQKRGHTKGKNLGDSGPTAKIQKMCSGGMAKAKKYVRGGGIEVRGKSKGKII